MKFIAKKFLGGFRCLKEHGVRYTILLFCQKVLNKMNKKLGISLPHAEGTMRLSTNDTGDKYIEYVAFLEQLNFKMRNSRANDLFVPITNRPIKPCGDDVKLLAWYLPQYYRMAVNDKYHGRGFTEWTSVSRGMPMFTGHYQPRLPYDVGFYTLTDPEVLARQVELAKMYGIYGFCFDYYWFSGERTMEKPIELFLKHPELDLKYCMHWCTENWTALWDGESNNLIFEQKLLEGDDERFMDDLLPYLRDDRYIKIDGKPVLMIYMCTMFEQKRFVELLKNFRAYARKVGFSDLYIMLTTAGNFNEDVADWGADALAEYPTINLGRCDGYPIDGYMNPNFFDKQGFLDMRSFIEEKRFMRDYKSETVYRSCLVNFDNSPRKAYSKSCWVTVNSTANRYKEWLKSNIEQTRKEHRPEEQYSFILAWNEWAECASMEPDVLYGYAYLQATKEALEETRPINENIILDEITEKKKKGIDEIHFYIHCIESLGDVIACEPIARYLKKIEPECKIAWIIKDNVAEVVKWNPFLDEVLEVQCLSQSIDIIDEKRKSKENIIIDCHQNGRRCVVTNRIHDNGNNPQVNEFTYLNYGPLLANFCYSAGLPAILDAPVFYRSGHIELLRDMPEKYVVFHCRSAEECKDWESGKWAELAKGIIKAGYAVIEIGYDPLVQLNSRDYYDFTHYRSIQLLAEIIRNAAYFVGVDSAFAHLANCFNIYGILLFGKYKYWNDPMMYTGKYADGSGATIIRARNGGLAKDITVDEVLSAFTKQEGRVGQYMVV